jgi:hypothetical protein
MAASPADRAEFTVAERDPFEPLEAGIRATIARRILDRAGFRVMAADGLVAAADPGALRAARASAPLPGVVHRE